MSALLVVVVDVLPEHEDEFNRWYDEEHIPQKRATPGFRSARAQRSSAPSASSSIGSRMRTMPR